MLPTVATRLARRARWLALKGAGALGTGVFVGTCGAGVGVALGALASIPREELFTDHGLFWHIDYHDSTWGVATVLAIRAVILVWQMIKHGVQRSDLLRLGVYWGGALGTLMGGLGALAVVVPEQVGFWGVFLSGLQGRSVNAMTRRRINLGGARRPQAQRVDVFGG